MTPESVESKPKHDDSPALKSKGWVRTFMPEILVTLLGETPALILMMVGAVATVGGAVVVGSTYGIVYLILAVVTIVVLAIIGWIMSWFT